jgi:energy-converting hydrogenase Eha subunit A
MEVAMERPLIAIVGSIDPHRDYDPAVDNTELARQACAELGRELANEGCGLIVYSASEGFIEASIVSGYVSSGKAEKGSIQVRSPYGGTAANFAEALDHREVFDVRPDSSRDWKVSYYRSLVDTQGVLLVGGGRSTLITGLIALAFRIPLVAVACFGGNARKVWEALDRVRNDATQEDVSAMAADWHEASARSLVKSLVGQQQRKRADEEAARRREWRQSRRTIVGLAVAVVLLLLGLGTIPLAWATEPGTAWNLAALIAAPLLAATCGAIVRNTFDQGRDWVKTALLGLVAGAIAFLLFVAAQLATSPDLLESPGARRLLFFVLPIGFIAGLTFDAVYSKLRAQDVTRTSVLEQS